MASRQEVLVGSTARCAVKQRQSQVADAGDPASSSVAQGVSTCVPVRSAPSSEKQDAAASKPSPPVSPAMALLLQSTSRAERPSAAQRTGSSLPPHTISGERVASCGSSSAATATAHDNTAAECNRFDTHLSSEKTPSASPSTSRAAADMKVSVPTKSGFSHYVSSVSASTAASSPCLSPPATPSNEIPPLTAANPAAAAAPRQGVEAVASSWKDTRVAQTYFRRGRVLVVRLAPLGTLEGTEDAAGASAGDAYSEVEEECPMVSCTLQKFRLSCQQSTGAAEGKYVPASILLQQVFTMAAALRPSSSSMRLPTSVSLVPATKTFSFGSSTPLRESVSSQETASAAPATSAQTGSAFQRTMPLPSTGLSSSSPSSSDFVPSSCCLSSSTESSASAVHASGCSSVFLHAAEVEALARHPIMRALGLYIRRGGVVALPTETVYGLGAAATIPNACQNIYKLKRRPPTDPLICHVASAQQAFDDVFDLDSDEDCLCLPRSSAAASLGDVPSTRRTAEVKCATLAAAPNTPLSAAPPPSAATSTAPAVANNTPTAPPAVQAAATQAAGAALVEEATLAAEEERGEGPAVLSDAIAVAAALPQTDASAAAHVGYSKRQHRKDMRLLVKALADAFWPGPLSIVAPGKILEDHMPLPQEREEGQGRTKGHRDGEEEEGKRKEKKEEREEREVKTQAETADPPKGVALAVTSGTRLVAVRCPCNKYALALTLAAGVPIAAPSANLFGRISPTRAQHVLNQFAAPEAAARTSSTADLQQENSDTGSQPSCGSVDSKQSSNSLDSGSSTGRAAVGEGRGEAAVKATATSTAGGAAVGRSRVDEHTVPQQAEGEPQQAEGEPQQPGHQQEQQLKRQFPKAEQQRRGRTEELPLFSGEDFALLETDGDDGGSCVGIESTVVKVAALAGPDSSAAAVADGEAAGDCRGCYEIQVLRRGVVTLDMLQEALQAAAARHNAAWQQQQQQKPEQQQRQRRTGAENVAGRQAAFTSFPRFVLTVSPKLQFHVHAQQSVRDSFIRSTATHSSQRMGHCSDETVHQAGSSGDRRKLVSTPSAAAGGTRNTLPATAEQELKAGGPAGPALLPKSSSSEACDGYLSSAAAGGPSARVGSEDQETTCGAGLNQKTGTAAPAGTQVAVDVTAAAPAAEKITAFEDRNTGNNASFAAGEMTQPEETASREQQALEAPGMALTHYAPCVPCYLVSAAFLSELEKRSGSSSRGSSALCTSSVAAVDCFERSSKKVCNGSEDAAALTPAEEVSDVLDGGATAAVSTHEGITSIECKDSILIDASKDFLAFAPHFLRYFSLVNMLGNSCAATEKKDGASTADARAAAAAVARGSASADAAAPPVCNMGPSSTEAPVKTPDVGRLNEVDAAGEDPTKGTAEKKKGAATGNRERQQAEQSTEEEALSCAWTQAAACSIFETLHAAEEVAVKEGARAIFIHAEPLAKGAERGLAVFDRLYRAASGKHARLQLCEADYADGGSPRFSFIV